MAMIISVAMIITMAVVTSMSGHHPNPSVDNEAQFGRIVANLFREDGWKVLEEPREKNVAPDFLVSGHGKKLVVELKRASEGRKDRVIPLPRKRSNLYGNGPQKSQLECWTSMAFDCSQAMAWSR